MGMPYGGVSRAAVVESPPVKSTYIVDKSAREIMVQSAGPCHVRNKTRTRIELLV